MGYRTRQFQSETRNRSDIVCLDSTKSLWFSSTSNCRTWTVSGSFGYSMVASGFSTPVVRTSPLPHLAHQFPKPLGISRGPKAEHRPVLGRCSCHDGSIGEAEIGSLISQSTDIAWELLAIRFGYIRLGLISKY
jgi:hypothetical protein